MSAADRIGGALAVDGATGLSYRQRVPLAAGSDALVVLLHGVGGNECNLAELATGFEASVVVVLPRGRLALGPDRFAWFPVWFEAGAPRIDAAAAEASRVALTAFVVEMQRASGIRPQRTLVAGFSQGGIMSASVALGEPERVAGFGVLSGRILPELAPHIAAPERLRRLCAFIGHGLEDDTLPVEWARRADRQLEALGVRHTTRLYPGGHALAAPMRGDFLAWASATLAG